MVPDYNYTLNSNGEKNIGRFMRNVSLLFPLKCPKKKRKKKCAHAHTPKKAENLYCEVSFLSSDKERERESVCL